MLFIGGFLFLWVSVLGFQTARERLVRTLGAIGWVLLAISLTQTTAEYLLTARVFLGIIGSVAVTFTLHAGSLVIRNADPSERLTFAFSVMGVLFLPFEFVDPIHSVVLNAVASHAAIGLALGGYETGIGYGTQGYANAIYFEGLSPRYGVAIVSACSGIGAIALFVGLIAASQGSVRKRILASVSIASFIYVLNVVRAVFVAGSIGGVWFGFGTVIVEPLYGITDPRLVSYYVAEYLISQVLIVLVLLWVYLRLSSLLPEIQEFVGRIVATAESDWNTLRGYR